MLLTKIFISSLLFGLVNEMLNCTHLKPSSALLDESIVPSLASIIVSLLRGRDHWEM